MNAEEKGRGERSERHRERELRRTGFRGKGREDGVQREVQSLEREERDQSGRVIE